MPTAPRPPDLPPTPQRDPAELAATDLREVEVAGLPLGSLALDNERIVDAVLHRPDAANSRARGLSLLRVELRGGRLTGTQWSESRIEDVLFAGCAVGLAAFRFTVFRRAVFRDCDLSEADFTGAHFDSVLFEDCRLAGAEVRECRFAHTELRGCDLSGLRGALALRGAAVPWSDLSGLGAALAAEVGIEVLQG